MSNYLTNMLNTSDYPDFIDTLREDFNIEVTQDHLLAEMVECDYNISNAYISIVFEGVSNKLPNHENKEDDINNMASNFYVNGERITGKDDVPPVDGTEQITVNAVDYLVKDNDPFKIGFLITQADKYFNDDFGEVEMVEDITGEYYEFYRNSEYITTTPHVNNFKEGYLEAVRWFIETEDGEVSK